MSNINTPVIQIVNQRTKNILKNRLKRDQLVKKMFETRMELYRTNIFIETEHVKMSDLKIKMYNRMNQLYESYKNKRRNNILIELEQRKMTEMKLGFINKLIKLDDENLSSNFEFNREIEINNLSNSMNYESPPKWEENKTKYEALKNEIDKEIELGEKEVESFKYQGEIHMQTLSKLINKKKTLEIEIQELNEYILPLNDSLHDGDEKHPITLVKIAKTDSNE